jgi:hypothetical protein
MSAYIVEKETIDRIVTVLRFDRESIEADIITHSFPELDHESNVIGQKLWAMNCEAVDQRYDEKNVIPLYQFEEKQSDKLELLQSLRCLLYQCESGDVDKTPLYKALSGYADHKAWSYIFGLPEYNELAWK